MQRRIIHKTEVFSGARPWDERPVIVFSVIPVLTVLIAIWAAVLEIAVVIARVVSQNKFPSDFKFVVCTVILGVAALVRWRWSRTHSAERELVERMSREGLIRPGLSVRGTWIVIAMVISVGCFVGWVFEP